MGDRLCVCKHDHVGTARCPVLDCGCAAYEPQPPGTQTGRVVQVIEVCDDCAPKIEATVRRLTAERDAEPGGRVTAAWSMSGGDLRDDGATAAGAVMLRVGKHAAGRELDGRTWDEYPEAVRRG